MEKVICFDLDGTLTLTSSWEAFNARLGITPEDDKRLFDTYLAGGHSYKEWILELMKLYTENDSVTKSEIEEVAEGMQFRPGASELIERAKQKGYHCIMVSGSVDTVTRVCAARLRIGEWFSTNKALYNEDEELTGIETMGDERDAKLLLLQEYCLKNGIDIEDVIAVADGGNDKEIFTHAKGIVVGDNAELVPLSWKKVSLLEEIQEFL